MATRDRRDRRIDAAPTPGSSPVSAASCEHAQPEQGGRQHSRGDWRHATRAYQQNHQGNRSRRRLRQDRDLQPGTHQGSHGGEDGRGRRAKRQAEAGRHDHRRHLGNYRHGPGDCRRQGLQVHLHHDRQAIGEKVDALKAFGAEVIVCPTNVDPEDPRSYYPVSSRLERETPNSGRQTNATTCRTPPRTTSRPGRRFGTRLKARSITSSLASARAGRSAGWRSTQGAQAVRQGVGHRHLRIGFQRNTKRRASSIRTRFYCTSLGIGEDLPQNVDFSLIDGFEKVTDRDAAIMTRRLPREEGIFAGNSGAAMAGLLQLAHQFKAGETVVVVFHDHAAPAISERCSTTSGCARRAS